MTWSLTSITLTFNTSATIKKSFLPANKDRKKFKPLLQIQIPQNSDNEPIGFFLLKNRFVAWEQALLEYSLLQESLLRHRIPFLMAYFRGKYHRIRRNLCLKNVLAFKSYFALETKITGAYETTGFLLRITIQKAKQL